MYNKLSLLVLTLIVLITAGSVYFISTLKFNYDFESYFPQGDDDLAFLTQYRNKFENDTDFLVIGVENKEGIFKKDFLLKIDRLTKSLALLKDVRQVSSITNFKYPILSQAGFFEVPAVHIRDQEILHQDSIKIFKNPSLVETLVSKDGKALLILLNTTQNIKKTPGDALLAKVEKTLSSFNFDIVHTAGKIKASKVYVEKMQSELVVFISISTVLISIILFIAYRAAWGVIFPLVTVMLAICWTLGIMGIFGKDLDLLTSLLPPILFVVAMSDMTHFISKYLEELRAGNRKKEALLHALKEVGLATFITAVTTAVGFITLMNSNIRPIRDFGFYTAIGVFVAFALAFSFIPAILWLSPEPAVAKKTTETLFWHRKLHALLQWIFRNKFFILSGSITLIFISLFFTLQIKVNSTLLDDISERDPLKQSVRFFEEKFGGVRPFEMEIGIRKPEENLLDYDVLKKVNDFEVYLRKEYGVKNIISPVTFVKGLNQAIHGGDIEYNKFPELEDYEVIKKKLVRFRKQKNFNAYLTPDLKSMRVNGKMNDIGSEAIGFKNEKLKMFFEKNLNETLTYKLTGSALLIDKNNYYLAGSLIEDLVLGVITIAIIIGFLFRSTRMVILALIPNLIPLLVIGGIMGIFDINLKASTSIIFSIAFGIAVDDSIHFLSRFKLELNQGKSLPYALKRTYISTGKAMVITSLII
ncbi:MAG TPA: MMPL family transporter, partial [Cytophagaceae bacterium]